MPVKFSGKKGPAPGPKRPILVKSVDPVAKSKRLQEIMGCLLDIINTLLAVLGAFLLFSGAVIMVRSQDYAKAKKDETDTSIGLWTLLVSGAQVLAIVCGVVGILQSLIGILGCCGVLHRGAIVLKMYALLALIISVVHLGTTGYVAYTISQISSSWFKDVLMKSVRDYDGKDNFRTYFLDHTQVKLGCCGVVSGIKEYQESRWLDVGATILPLSCCQLKTGQKVDDFDFSNKELLSTDLLNPGCPSLPSVGKAFTSVPCLDKARDYLQPAYVVAISALLFSVLLLGGGAYMAFRTTQLMKGPLPPKPGPSPLKLGGPPLSKPFPPKPSSVSSNRSISSIKGL